ncbi:MAG TPA: DUF4440 domain-containing protein [Candidatus Angelobacter sp.]|jgi:hypothetical protein|nr:DUF4440 domain-containing protein [Candidatus Angelobacter sp.]
MRLPDKDTACFFDLETSLHNKQVRNCADATSALLADAFIEFGSSGKVWNKSSIIESMRREKLDQQITVEDFAAQELAPDVVLVTYISKRVVEDQLAVSTLRSSIWKLFDGKWQMIFHQGTRTSA